LVIIEWHAPSSSVFLCLARQPNAGSDIVEAETTGDAQIAVAPAPLAALLGEFSSAQLRVEITDKLAIRTDGKVGVCAASKWDFTTPRTSVGASVRASKSAAATKGMVEHGETI
jgi:hypothetical protein